MWLHLDCCLLWLFKQHGRSSVCVIILRGIIAVLAPVTRFPLHSSCAGSLPEAPELVACLDLTCVMGQPQNPGL